MIPRPEPRTAEEKIGEMMAHCGYPVGSEAAKLYENRLNELVKIAMNSARAEGYTEGVALGPGMPFADQTSALLKEAYAEGQAAMRERAAKVVDENICSRLACDCCDSEKSVIKKIRAIPLSEGKEA